MIVIDIDGCVKTATIAMITAWIFWPILPFIFSNLRGRFTAALFCALGRAIIDVINFLVKEVNKQWEPNKYPKVIPIRYRAINFCVLRPVRAFANHLQRTEYL